MNLKKESAGDAPLTYFLKCLFIISGGAMLPACKNLSWNLRKLNWFPSRSSSRLRNAEIMCHPSAYPIGVAGACEYQFKSASACERGNVNSRTIKSAASSYDI